MPNYRVTHIYHSKVANVVEAESEEEAIAKSREQIDGNYIACNAETYDEYAREIEK